MERGWGGLAPLGLLFTGLALATGLAGCSGTPWGDQLARSFSAPAGGGASASVPAGPTAAQAPAQAPAQAGGAGAQAPRAEQSKAVRAAADQGSANPPRPLPAPKPAPATPAPYRITLRLPGADPAAPAEAVTEALRAAGLSFEVEMIERVRSGDGEGRAPAPTAVPAPPLR